MRAFLLLILPSLLIFLAPVGQIFLSALRLKGRIRIPLLLIDVMALIAGGLLSMAATIISIYGLSPNVHCATGCGVFVVFGFLITIVSVPVISIITFLSYRSKTKSVNSNPA